MENENKIDSTIQLNRTPEANQIVINKNIGTIHIHNNNKTNDKAIDSFIESERLSEKNIADFIKTASEIANKIIELEKLVKTKKKKS